MFTTSEGIGRQLVLCDKDINSGQEVFLDTGNQEPVTLFGGNSHAAEISSEGEVIFINRDSVKNLLSSRIPSFSLPDGEKASSIACCAKLVVVLSSSGRVMPLFPFFPLSSFWKLFLSKLKKKKIKTHHI